MNIEYMIKCSLLGYTCLAKTEKGICYIAFDDESQNLIQDLYRRFPYASLKENTIALQKEWDILEFHLKNPNNSQVIPFLDIYGTEFQKKVWNVLIQIPAGKTKTYKEIALLLNAPKSIRAVANACAANKIAYFIPCHRVVASNGSIAGYRWGVKRKNWLLLKEKSY